MSNPGYCPDCKESGWACTCRADHYSKKPAPTNSPTSTEQVNTPHEDGSLTLCNAAVQRLLDYGILHYTDEGYYVGKWPGTNTPSRNTPADSEVERAAWLRKQADDVDEHDLEFVRLNPEEARRIASLLASLSSKPVDGEVAELVEWLRGLPSKIVRQRFSVEALERLNRIADMLLTLSRNTEPMVTDAMLVAGARAAADRHIECGSYGNIEAIYLAMLSAGKKGTDDA